MAQEKLSMKLARLCWAAEKVAEEPSVGEKEREPDRQLARRVRDRAFSSIFFLWLQPSSTACYEDVQMQGMKIRGLVKDLPAFIG